MIWKTTPRYVKALLLKEMLQWKGNVKQMIPGILTGVLCFLSLSVLRAQQLVPIEEPLGSFEIDGDLTAGSAVPGNLVDWVPYRDSNGNYILSGNNFIFYPDGTPVYPGTSVLIKDLFESSNDNVFAGGSKYNDDPNDWSAKTAAASPEKGDMNNAFYHIATNSQTNEQWLFVGSDRLKNDGTSYIDFEFFQNPLIMPVGNGNFTSEGPEGGRTPNDLLVTIEYEKGGSNAMVHFYLWEDPDNDGTYEYIEKNLSNQSLAYARGNEVQVPVPFSAFGENSFIYEEYLFVEAGLNMTDIFSTFSTNNCGGVAIKSLLVKTKTSAAPSATLIDFTGPVDVKINFGNAEIAYDPNPVCGSYGEISPTISGVQGGTFSAPAGLSIAADGTINTLTSTPGTYTVTYTYESYKCQKSTTYDITILENPDAPVTGNTVQSFCSIDIPKVKDLSATGTDIKWYAEEGDENPLDPETELTDGEDYFATQTQNGCESVSYLQVTVNLDNPSAPVGEATQSFCAIDLPTIADLEATGTDITWYADANSMEALASTTPLQNNEDYFASQTIDNCEGISRLAVTVTIKDPSAPTGAASQSFCAIDLPTIADLVATGTNITWYPDVNSTQALAGTTPLQNNEDYFASQTIDGCESDTRLAVTVTIKDPAAPTGVSEQAFCAIDLPTIADLEVTGQNIIWYASAESTQPLATTTPLENNEDYFATQTLEDCESDRRFAVNVTIKDPVAPTGESIQSFCFTDNAVISDLEVNGQNISWYATADSDQALAASTALENGEDYFASQTLNNCESDTRFKVTVEILPEISLSTEANTVTCNGASDGLITITSDDVSTVKIYNSSSQDVTDQNGSLPAGIYTIVASIESELTSLVCEQRTEENIEVRDNVAPEIVVPQELTLELCEASEITAQNARFALDTDGSGDIKDSFAAAGYSATDDQEIVSITYTDLVTNPGNCRPVVTRTFYVSDNCGSQSSATMQINLIDTTAPEFNETLPPATITVECDNVPAAAVLTASDNCEDKPEVFFNEEISGRNDDCSDTYTITRTWSVTDCSDNNTEFVQVITVRDTTAPQFNEELPEAQLTVECDDVPAAVILTATDNCAQNVEVSFTEEFSGQDDACSDTYMITRTWKVSDCANNENSFVQTIEVIDTEAPQFRESLPEAEITVECDDVPVAAVLTATDNCAQDVEVVFTEEFSGQNDSCSDTYVITRTWEVSDCAGNTTSFTQNINVIDTTAPEFNEALPQAEMTVECDNVPDAVVLTATDNCAQDVIVDFNEEITGQDDTCGDTFTITRTWSVSDCADNTTSFTQVINVVDTRAPQFNESLPSTELNVECDAIPDPVILTASDICAGNPEVIYSEEFTGMDDDCSSNYIIQRTWTVSDCAGNETSFTQTVNVFDNTAPEFNEAIPADMNQECENIPEPPVITATDNCDEQVEVIFTETSTKENEADKEYTVTRNWSVSDCAGNTTEATQVITVQNTGAPAFNENLPGDINVECDAIPEAPVITATDNCVTQVDVIYTEEFSGLDDECSNEYTITRTWYASDEAGNEISHTQTIQVEDSIAPEFDQELPAASVTAECDAIPEPEILTASDNCSEAVEVIFDEEISNRDSAEDFTYNITRTWTVTDCAGNETSFSQVINVEDTTAPVIISCAEPVTVAADDGVCTASGIDLGSLNAEDNCNSSLSISNNAPDSFPIGETTVIWTVTDEGGNSTECSQLVTVIDEQAPVVEAMQDITANSDTGSCGAIVEYVLPEVSDNCEVSSVEVTEGLVSGSEFKIGTTPVTITVTDASGNTTDISFEVTVEDNEAPSITCPGDINATTENGQSFAIVNFEEATATDNCSVSVEQTAGPASGSAFEIGTTTVTYTATDAAGNSTECSFTVTVTDEELPVIECPSDISQGVDAGTCGAIVAFETPTASDNSGQVSVTQTAGPASGEEFPVGDTVVTFTVTDDASNSVDCSFTVHIEDDEAPSIECPGDMEIEVERGTESVAIDYTAVSVTDNCGETNVELTEGIASGENFPLGTTKVTYRVTDAAGNSATCSFNVTVTEEPLPPVPASPTGSVSTQASCSEPTGTITIETQDGLSYSVDGENYQSEGIFTNLEPGTYLVTARDEFGQVSEAATIAIEAPVAAEITPESISICVDEVSFDLFDLLPDDADDSGSWTDPDETGALNGSIIDPTLLELGDHSFRYVLAGNCPYEVDAIVNINDDCVQLPCSIEDIRGSISKAVTPNGDSHNDYFTIDFAAECGFSYDLKIFNRWGAKVYDARNYQNNWDGYSERAVTSSNQLPSGTYYYVLEIRNSGLEPIQGYIYLGTK